MTGVQTCALPIFKYVTDINDKKMLEILVALQQTSIVKQLKKNEKSLALSQLSLEESIIIQIIVIAHCE